MKTANLTFFFLLISNVFVFECNGEYEFGIEMVKSFSCARPGESITKQIIEEHFFYRLNSEEKWRLCFIAKEHASKEGVALRSIDLVEEVNKCTVSYQNVDLKRDHVGLKCPFIPFVLLRLVGDSDEKVAIAIQRNPFLNKRYEFKEEIVEDVRYVTVVGSNSRRAWRESYFYSKLNYRTRWEMCVAAIFRIRHNVATFPSDDWSEIVGVYNILYSNGTALKHVVAFPCNTSPETYLRTDSRHKFTVMLKRY